MNFAIQLIGIVPISMNLIYFSSGGRVLKQ